MVRNLKFLGVGFLAILFAVVSLFAFVPLFNNVVKADTAVFVPETWNAYQPNISNFSGIYVYKIGNDYFYCRNSSACYKLNGSTWESYTWQGACPLGNTIWSDGVNYYSSPVNPLSTQIHYKLIDNAWVETTFNISLGVSGLWYYNNFVYYNNYKFNGSTWESCSFNKSISGSSIFVYNNCAYAIIVENFSNKFYKLVNDTWTLCSFVNNSSESFPVPFGSSGDRTLFAGNIWSYGEFCFWKFNVRLTFQDLTVTADNYAFTTAPSSVWTNTYARGSYAYFRDCFWSSGGVLYFDDYATYNTFTYDEHYSLSGSLNSSYLDYLNGYSVGYTNGYESGYNDGITIGESSGYENGYSVGYEAGLADSNADYQSGYTAGQSSGYQSGYTAGQSSGYQSGYTAGESSGYDSGYSAGESAGYSSGYSVGQDIGYQSGLIAGAAASNNYSFLALMSSIIDAPVRAFTGLLDFNVLGVHMSEFILSLLTLSIVFVIVRLVLGRRG